MEMNNTLRAVILVTGLLGMQAQAAVVESVTGEEFAGYASTFISTNTTLWTDLGNSVDGTDWSTDPETTAGRITDTSAATSVLGDTAGAYIDLAFDVSITDGAGDDLKLFFVGGNGHDFDVTIGGVTNSYSLASNENATGFFDPAYPTDPIIALALDLSSFSGLTGSSFSEIRLTIGDGFTTPSAVTSFVGTYNVVPVPAAVWLFGSGLIGLVGLARRRK
jgi:hypothetical protein